jgi:hypothetical protein
MRSLSVWIEADSTHSPSVHFPIQSGFYQRLSPSKEDNFVGSSNFLWESKDLKRKKVKIIEKISGTDTFTQLKLIIRHLLFGASSTSKATSFPQWSENISTTDVAYNYFDLT